MSVTYLIVVEYLIVEYRTQYPNGKIWPLLIDNKVHIKGDLRKRKSGTKQSGLGKFGKNHGKTNDSSNRTNTTYQRKEAGNDNKGGTYNPRQAWQVIDRGRQEVFAGPAKNRNGSAASVSRGGELPLHYFVT